MKAKGIPGVAFATPQLHPVALDRGRTGGDLSETELAVSGTDQIYSLLDQDTVSKPRRRFRPRAIYVISLRGHAHRIRGQYASHSSPPGG